MYEWWTDRDLMVVIFLNILFFGAIGVMLIEKAYYWLKYKNHSRLYGGND